MHTTETDSAPIILAPVPFTGRYADYSKDHVRVIPVRVLALLAERGLA